MHSASRLPKGRDGVTTIVRGRKHGKAPVGEALVT